ncbi:HAD-IC family P-type ATPase [Mesorhizobium sp. PAMC28654]|uniref:HAD-IC family P-type ATPase n=1 Tax=Mesorhizobium sp. PAMC28654 TaxID=2880934 RepID=UPI002221EA00|nr:HAD-IC family P-type ATPase [Mesorhizobium sp. PAMC28654]
MQHKGAQSPAPSTARPAEAYWSRAAADLLSALGTSAAGLPPPEAASRLAKGGPNAVGDASKSTAIGTFIRQFRSPLVLILVFAAGVSAVLGDASDAAIIGLIVLVSCFLSFTQEYGASRAMDALRQRVSRKVTVVRDGVEAIVSAEDIVPGDIIRLSAGNLIPADGIILDARDFNVSEATLTGETFPVVKAPGQSPVDATIAQRSNAVYTGTSVRSGTATILAVQTGGRTEFASITAAIERRVPETNFAKGIRRFGYLMTQIMLAIVIVVFAANLLLHRPLIDSLLFSLALAVGLTPELLPYSATIWMRRERRSG